MKKILTLVGVPVLATGFLAAVPHVAHASGYDQSCVVSEVVTYDPPLSDTASPNGTTVTVNGQLFRCTSHANSAGSYTETATVQGATCTSLLSGAPGLRTFGWTNTASTPSQFSYNRTVTRANGNLQVEFMGSIVMGTYTPDPATQTVTFPEPNAAACSGNGVSTIAGGGVLLIGTL